MVPVEGLDHWSLSRTLTNVAADDVNQPLHARAFASWIRQDLPIQANLLKTLAGEAISDTERRSDTVALLGYASSIDPAYVRPFADGVAWLRERQYFVSGKVLVFEVNGLALLGVAIGLQAYDAANREAAIGWLKSLLANSLSQHRPSDWNEALIASAAEIFGDQSASAKVTGDLRVALAGRGILTAGQAAHASAWSLIAGLTGCEDGMTRAAAQSAALAVLVRESSALRSSSNAVADVANILGGIAKSMRRWAWEDKPRTSKSTIARWVIDNEYHVQDMLWVILAPIFPDLDDEEWLKSLGQHHPRADLAIPSLHVIIEVKFARKDGKSFGDLIQEVAADASTYLQDGSGYSSIVAFIWDDAARTEEHSELRQGLLRIRGCADAIVVSRPRKMVRSQAAS